MARLSHLFLGLALVCVWMVSCPLTAADEKIDVTGTWEVEVDLGGNSGNPVFTFKQEGEKLTGKYKGQLGEADVTGKIKGKEIEFTFSTDAGKAVYTGTVEKDTMKGKAKYGEELSGTFTGKKKKDAK